MERAMLLKPAGWGEGDLEVHSVFVLLSLFFPSWRADFGHFQSRIHEEGMPQIFRAILRPQL